MGAAAGGLRGAGTWAAGGHVNMRRAQPRCCSCARQSTQAMQVPVNKQACALLPQLQAVTLLVPQGAQRLHGLFSRWANKCFHAAGNPLKVVGCARREGQGGITLGIPPAQCTHEDVALSSWQHHGPTAVSLQAG